MQARGIPSPFKRLCFYKSMLLNLEKLGHKAVRTSIPDVSESAGGVFQHRGVFADKNPTAYVI